MGKIHDFLSLLHAYEKKYSLLFISSLTTLVFMILAMWSYPEHYNAWTYTTSKLGARTSANGLDNHRARWFFNAGLSSFLFAFMLLIREEIQSQKFFNATLLIVGSIGILLAYFPTSPKPMEPIETPEEYWHYIGAVIFVFSLLLYITGLLIHMKTGSRSTRIFLMIEIYVALALYYYYAIVIKSPFSPMFQKIFLLSLSGTMIATPFLDKLFRYLYKLAKPPIKIHA